MRCFVFAPVLAALVPGCWLAPCPSYVAQDSVTFTPTWSELAAALDATGDLTEEGCADLCAAEIQLRDIESMESCGFVDPSVVPVTVPESADTGDTGVPAAPDVSCIANGVPVCQGGRDHASILGRSPCTCTDPVGAFLADAALAEATSVKAFVALARELTALGAPAGLAERARSAALDEVVHARLLTTEARVHGARVPRATFRPTPTRGLLAFAIENAVEGCVNETWAAIVAAHQSVHSVVPTLRAAYARITADEVRHAELAWAIDAWLGPLLTAGERAEVEGARRAAVERLFASAAMTDPDVARVVGLPTLTEARRLLHGMVSRVWEPAARAA